MSRAAIAAWSWFWLPAVVGGLPAQANKDKKLAEFSQRLEKHYIEAGQAYVEIGWWARKVGLVPQATTMFLRAQEAAQGRHHMVEQLVQMMRNFGDAFWSKKRKKAPAYLVSQCDGKVRSADKRTRKSHLEVCKAALAAGKEDEARAHCQHAIKLGAEITVDKAGKYAIDGVAIPAELAKWLQERTVATAAGDRVFETAAAAGGPRLEGFHEHKDDQLVVRTDLGADRAAALHGLGLALLPHLQERLEGVPSRPLVLLVFGKRADFSAYLKSLGIDSHAGGLAEYGSFQTIVCAEGREEPELHALILHELSHLYFYGTAPAVMPDWYAEGFAESFGGQGTFRWDGKALTVGAPMAEHRLAALKAAPMPLAELLAGDAEQLWADDPAKALRFYAAAWAFQRFLLAPDCRWREAFLDWEGKCRGAVLGVEPGQPGMAPAVRGKREPAAALFTKEFGKDLKAIEAAFQAFVQGL